MSEAAAQPQSDCTLLLNTEPRGLQRSEAPAKRKPTRLIAALIWSLETFRPYVYGIHVLIRTDHAPLEYIRQRSDKCARLMRWFLRLQEFQFTINHRSGAQQKRGLSVPGTRASGPLRAARGTR